MNMLLLAGNNAGNALAASEVGRPANYVFTRVQGDTTRCFQPSVDNKTKVTFVIYQAPPGCWHTEHILNRNHCLHVNRRLETT